MQTMPAPDVMLTDLFDALPESVLWFKPVWSAGNEVVDFSVAYCNQGASDLLQAPRNQLLGQHVLTTQLIEEEYRQKLFGQCLQVWQTGRQQQYNYYSPQLQRHFSALRSKVLGGVLSVTHDCTAFKLSEQERMQQTHLLQGILDAAINGVFYCEALRNEEGTIVDLEFKKINKGFSRLIGKTEAEVIGKTYLSLFPTALLTGLFALNCHVINTGEPVRKEVYYQGEGLDAWYDVSLVRLGQNGLVVTFSDITGNKNSENKLRESEGRLRTIINTSQSGMFTLLPVRDDSGAVTDFRFGIVNQSVASYIGQTAEVLTGALASRYFPAYTGNGLFAVYKDTYEKGTSHNFDFHYEDGYDVYFNIHTVKMGDEVLVTFTDHTALKRLQLQLEQSIDDLKRSNANLEEFAYAASHDLQEPLRKIHFFSERLHNNIQHLLKEEDKQMFARMEAATQRMRTLIDDLLTYARFSMPTAVMEDTNLQLVVQQALADLETTINEKGATVEIAHLPRIHGDERQLRQMFQNLFSNALKYSKAGVPPVIKVDYTKTEEKIANAVQPYHRIAISDNGIGFDQQYAEKIFQVFQRLHGKSEYPGTGVGLAIVQKVVVNHHGFITAQSEVGKGSVFTLYLPAQA